MFNCTLINYFKYPSKAMTTPEMYAIIPGSVLVFVSISA